MNLNNLENLKKEMKSLGFNDKLISQMEEQMKKDASSFNLYDRMPATKGEVDLTLSFKQSSKSDYYYLNQYEASHNKSPLVDGKKYMVISSGEKGKNIVKKFENSIEAVAFFKEQKGKSELASGKDAAHKETLATMEDGKVNFIKKDFQRTYYAPPVSQTFYVEKGKGFTAQQAANLIQGRAVYRDDLLSLAGQSYKAWIKLDFDKPKDRNNNYTTNQYHDPSYGFDLKKVLDKFDIKELNDPAKREKLEASLKNGDRVIATVQKGEKDMKVQIEAVPRYSQINMFSLDGKIEKREQFLSQGSNINQKKKSEDTERVNNLSL